MHPCLYNASCGLERLLSPMRIVTLVGQRPRSSAFPTCAKNALSQAAQRRVLWSARVHVFCIAVKRRSLRSACVWLLLIPGLLQKEKRHGQASRISRTKPYLAWGGWNPSNIYPHDASTIGNRCLMHLFCSRGRYQGGHGTALRRRGHYDTYVCWAATHICYWLQFYTLQ